jgi:hypothetical protein
MHTHRGLCLVNQAIKKNDSWLAAVRRAAFCSVDGVMQRGSNAGGAKRFGCHSCGPCNMMRRNIDTFIL